MEALQAIFTRRSIRKYTDRPVPDADVTEILTAAMYAPSAGNQRPWHFVVITERAILDQIPAFHPHASMVKAAPVAVLVCGDPSLEKHAGYWVQDCAAAVMNLLLAVTARGLGAVWTGVYPREDRVKAFRKLLNIPEGVVPFALVPIGFPAETPAQPNRFDPARTHRNGWQAR